MKLLISFFILFMSILYGDMNEQYLNTKNISLKVINVDINDTLNLRAVSSPKSIIVTIIPNDSTTLKTTGKIDGQWLQIEYTNQKTQLKSLGWVHKHYVKPIEKYKVASIGKMKFSYPSFLAMEQEKDGWTHFQHEVDYIFEQYRDGRDGVVKQNKLVDFNLHLKIYDTFEEALTDNCLQDYDFSKKRYGEFDPVQKIPNGFTVRTGVEGVGQIFSILQKSNKTVVFALNYNMNPITPLQKRKPIVLQEEDKRRIQEDIFKTMTESM